MDILTTPFSGVIGALSATTRKPPPPPPKTTTISTPLKPTAPTTTPWGNQKRVCVMSQKSIAGLSTFAAMVGRKVVDCSMVYNAPVTWTDWTQPWFLGSNQPDMAWGAWVRSSPANDRRQLVISQPLIPAGVAGTDWRAQGAAGAYTGYAKQLAQNLVAAGVGDAVIRLSWEMNGTWNLDNIGSTPTDMAEWVAFYRNTVLAMRSVPGANFKFVWCINNGYRNIPFASYYPGDDVVDSIGDDVYDAGAAGGQPSWSTIYGQPGGLGALIAFAKAHNKPLSLPEWGVGVKTSTDGYGGDDPAFINDLASVVASNQVAFQSYFWAHEWYTELNTGPLSLAAYHADFGDGGDAVGTNNGMGM